MDGVALEHLKNLRTLRLEGNMLQKIPTDTLIGLASSLEALWVLAYCHKNKKYVLDGYIIIFVGISIFLHKNPTTQNIIYPECIPRNFFCSLVLKKKNISKSSVYAQIIKSMMVAVPVLYLCICWFKINYFQKIKFI